MTADKHDRRMLGWRDGRLQFKPVDVGQRYIQNQTTRYIWIAEAKVFSRRFERDGARDCAKQARSEIASRTLKSSSTMMTNSAFCVIQGLPQRQRERKYRSLRLVITHSKHSAVSLNNGATDCKADAEAIFLGAIKRFKCFVWMRQSGAKVADFDDYASIRTMGANYQSLRVAFRIIHRFCAVANEVH